LHSRVVGPLSGTIDKMVETRGERSVKTVDYKVEGYVTSSQIDLTLNGHNSLELSPLELGVQEVSLTNPGAQRNNYQCVSFGGSCEALP
jgi:hypothetical protein